MWAISARDRMMAIVVEHVARLAAASARGDEEEIEDRRHDLLDALRKRQGIIDAIGVMSANNSKARNQVHHSAIASLMACAIATASASVQV